MIISEINKWLNIVNLKTPGIVELEKNISVVKGSLLKVKLKENINRFSYVFNSKIINTSLNGDLLIDFVFNPFYAMAVNEEVFAKKASEIWNLIKL